jgi:hypothetical protein
MTREQEQDALIAAWSATQPEEVRRKVAALPKMSGPSHEVGAAEDVATWERQAAPDWSDPASWCDSEPDRLQEMFGLTAQQANGVFEWAEKRQNRAVMAEQGDMLSKMLECCLQDRINNIWPVLWALAFQLGVARRFQFKKTTPTPNAVAKHYGVTRALMSHWACKWENLLGFRDSTWAKSKEARANMRAARLRVVAQKNMAATAAQSVAAANLPVLVRDSHGDTETRGQEAI